MPTKRPDETKDAFVIRTIRDDEAEACIEVVIDAGVTLAGYGQEHPQIIAAIINALRQRIGSRAEG